ncbi:MAG: DUF502 domain-containing protein [Tepidisphaeraceae bacterium]
MAPSAENPSPGPYSSSRQPVARRRMSFGEDFRRFFLSGMAALLPTLITLWLLVKLWDFLWENLGRHIIFAIREIWYQLGSRGVVRDEPAAYIREYWSTDSIAVRIIGVVLAVLLVYVVGVIVGNFIGRTFYRVIERAVMRIPLVRAVYPAVKQVTDFILSNRRRDQFASSHVVAVQPHEQGIWSIGLITGGGLKPLADATGEEMVTVFVPSTPTAFTGYVLVAPRKSVVELPMTVEEAMRLLVSGGVIVPAAEPQKGVILGSAAHGLPLAASRIGDAGSSAKPQAAAEIDR